MPVSSTTNLLVRRGEAARVYAGETLMVEVPGPTRVLHEAYHNGTNKVLDRPEEAWNKDHQWRHRLVSTKPVTVVIICFSDQYSGC